MIHAVVLAAGASSRYGVSPPKQQALLPQVLAGLRRSEFVDAIVVVTGAHELRTDLPTVHCAEWARGPGASLRCGLAALPEEAEAAVVVLGDGPDLDPEAIDRVIERWRAEPAPVVAATYDGTRLHPVLLARNAWPHVPDDGARTL